MFNDKDFMGGMFDFDGNGKTTLDEQYVAYKIYEETTKEEKTILNLPTTNLQKTITQITVLPIAKAQR